MMLTADYKKKSLTPVHVETHYFSEACVQLKQIVWLYFLNTECTDDGSHTSNIPLHFAWTREVCQSQLSGSIEEGFLRAFW